MPDYNKVMLMGRLTRDPELRVTNSGTAVANLGLATGRKYKDKSGQMQEDTTFVDLTAWDKNAENLAKYFSKGDPIFIEGRLQLEQWETKDGEKRSKLGVIVDRFEFLQSRGESEQQPQQRSAPRQEQAPKQATQAPADDFSDDDVPF